MELINKEEATNKGLKLYSTGKSCDNGHKSKRYVANNHCVECQLLSLKVWRKNNKEKHLECNRKWKQNNPEKYKAQYLSYNVRPEIQLRNKEFFKIYNETHKDENRERKLSWNRRNKEKVKEIRRYHKGLRRALLLQACPMWANLEKIREIYKNRPDNVQVDHIIPLKGKLVCGLHVENNLQYLTKKENTEKGNKFDSCSEKPCRKK